jgi:hypothetical protein
MHRDASGDGFPGVSTGPVPEMADSGETSMSVLRVRRARPGIVLRVRAIPLPMLLPSVLTHLLSQRGWWASS